MRRILVFGASGTVGSKLVEALQKDGGYDVYGTYHSKLCNLPPKKSFQLSVNELDSLEQILQQVRPQDCISALRGSFEQQRIFHQKLARFLKENGGRMVFCSTTNVFDRALSTPHSRPYHEDDPTDPISDYGKFKADCEKEMWEILGENVCIVRIPMVFGKVAPRMVELLRQAEAGEEIKVYRNLYLNFITDEMLANQILYILNHDLRGIFHLATKDMMTQAEFIRTLLEKMGYPDANVKEISTDFPASYFAIVSKRNDFPPELTLTIPEMIKYLTEETV